jgi:hypothetical protein
MKAFWKDFGRWTDIAFKYEPDFVDRFCDESPVDRHVVLIDVYWTVDSMHIIYNDFNMDNHTTIPIDEWIEWYNSKVKKEETYGT